jgi:hypothetical protein
MDCIKCSEDYLLALLKRQPALRDLRIGFMTLEQGRWSSATRHMRKSLNLDNFLATGILEDADQMFAMHFLDSDAYAQDFTRISMGDALGLWVTDEPDAPDHDNYHPLLDEDFADEDELREQFGPFEDDSLSEMDCDSD